MIYTEHSCNYLIVTLFTSLINVDNTFDNSLISLDHFPLFMTVTTGNITLIKIEYKSTSTANRVNWSNVSDQDISTYTENSGPVLSLVRINHQCLLCDDLCCNGPTHTNNKKCIYNKNVFKFVHHFIDSTGRL